MIHLNKLKVETYLDAPPIGEEIKNIIEGLSDVNNFVLSLQLDYRDNNTIFYLNRVQLIEFKTDMLHISQEEKSHVYISYGNIVEYAVINAEDVLDLGVI